MNKLIILAVAGVIIAAGGVTAADVYDPLNLVNNTNITDNATNTSGDTVAQNSTDPQNNDSNVTGDQSPANNNMDEIASDNQKAVDYLNSKGEDKETVQTSKGPVTLYRPHERPSNYEHATMG